MTGSDDPDDDESTTVDDTVSPGRVGGGWDSTKRRRALSRLRRELTDDELSSSGTQKMMLDEIARMEDELERMKDLRDRYHAVDRRLAVAEARVGQAQAFDFMVVSSMTLGGAAVGAAPAIWEKAPYGTIALLIGVFLIASGAIATVIKGRATASSRREGS